MTINACAMTRGADRYVLMWADGQESAVLQTIGRWASNPELSLTWWDAAKLTREVLKAKRQAKKEARK